MLNFNIFAICALFAFFVQSKPIEFGKDQGNRVVRGPFGGTGGSPTQFLCKNSAFITKINAQAAYFSYLNAWRVSFLEFWCSDETVGSIGRTRNTPLSTTESKTGFHNFTISGSSSVTGFGVGGVVIGEKRQSGFDLPGYRMVGFTGRHGDVVDQLAIVFEKIAAPQVVLRGPFGGNGGSPSEFSCGNDEYVDEIKVQHHDYWGARVLITYLEFRCSGKKSVGTIGTKVNVPLSTLSAKSGFDNFMVAVNQDKEILSGLGSGDKFYGAGSPQVVMAPGFRLIGFSGRGGDYVDNISFYFRETLSKEVFQIQA